jgi:hypothetical protein
MALDDLLESEVGLAVAATAAVLSPRVRSGIRRGAVYAVAGALVAGDALVDVARSVGEGAGDAMRSAGGAAAGTAASVMPGRGDPSDAGAA